MDLDTVRTMLEEGLLRPDQVLKDVDTGQSLPVSNAVSGIPVPAPAPSMPPPSWHAAPPTPLPEIPVPDSSLLGARLGGYILDALCATPLIVLAALPFLGILFAPILALYWVSRD